MDQTFTMLSHYQAYRKELSGMDSNGISRMLDEAEDRIAYREPRHPNASPLSPFPRSAAWHEAQDKLLRGFLRDENQKLIEDPSPDLKTFSTGAKRSKDAEGECYTSISPIGLRRLAKIQFTTC